MATSKQPRLFDPGPKSGDPWALHPDKWVARPDIVYHASDEPTLPRQDRGPGHQLEYGGSAGMHFGTKAAAYERSTTTHSKEYIHAARLNTEQFRPKQVPGHIPVKPTWDDEAANFRPDTEQAVRAGLAVPYRNQFEDIGSTSYRVLPEKTRTWSEDVKATPSAAPALKYLADNGFNPGISKSNAVDHNQIWDEYTRGPRQKQLFGADLVKGGKSIAFGTEDEMQAETHKRLSQGEYVGFTRNNAPVIKHTGEYVAKVTPKLRRPGS